MMEHAAEACIIYKRAKKKKNNKCAGRVDPRVNPTQTHLNCGSRGSGLNGFGSKTLSPNPTHAGRVGSGPVLTSLSVIDTPYVTIFCLMHLVQYSTRNYSLCFLQPRLLNDILTFCDITFSPTA